MQGARNIYFGGRNPITKNPMYNGLKVLNEVYDKDGCWMEKEMRGTRFNLIDIDHVEARILFNGASDKSVHIDNLDINCKELGLIMNLNFDYHYVDNDNNELMSKGVMNNMAVDKIKRDMLDIWVSKYIFRESKNCKVMVGFNMLE